MFTFAEYQQNYYKSYIPSRFSQKPYKKKSEKSVKDEKISGQSKAR
jgi:hypothetical protein